MINLRHAGKAPQKGKSFRITESQGKKRSALVLVSNYRHVAGTYHQIKASI